MAVDDDEDTPEAAMARKQARKDKIANTKARKAGLINGASDAGSPSASRASTEEQETPKKRGRKPGPKSEKRKAEEGDEEPPAKKRRGPLGRPKAVPVANGSEPVNLSAQQRTVLQESLRRLYDGLMNLEVDDPDPEPAEDDDDEPAKRLIIGPFVKLPSKRDYGDYYLVIQRPICMNNIQGKIRKMEYNSLSDMRLDIQTLCNNCRTYNDDGSLLYADANTMEVS